MPLQLLTRDDIPKDALTVSPSQMSMWYRCRYAWKLSKIDQIGDQDRKPIGAANKGQIFHKFMQWYYTACIGRPVGRLNELGQMKALDYVKASYSADPDLFRVFTIFIAYTDWAAKHEELVPLGAEVETFAPTGLVSRDGRDIYLHGFIDLLADLLGKIIFVDHKSHTSRPWTKSRLFYDHQFYFYWLMLELQGVHVDGAFVNSVDLNIPADSKKFKANVVGVGTKNIRPRFERIRLSERDVKLQFYLDQFLTNIKEMWCATDPVYPMRLSSDCDYCVFKEHIEFDARGRSEGALVALHNRLTTQDFTLIDDDDESDDLEAEL
jgi:PD-(D/E)XK nuclease superfamily